MARRNVDWAPVRRDFEANVLSGDEVASKHGVDRASMYRAAKREGWQKNLAKDVQARTAAKLVHATVAGSAQGAGKQQSNSKATANPALSKGTPAPGQVTPTTPGTPATTPATTPSASESVELAAAVNVQVILSHRGTIARARRLTDRLFDEAEAQFGDSATLLPLVKGELLLDGKPVPAKARAAMATAIARARDLPQRAVTAKALTEALRVQLQLERQAFGIGATDGGDDDDTDFRQRLLDARARALNARH